MFALLLASISVFNSCKPKDPDDEQNLDDNENEEEIVEDEIVSPDYVPIDWENASIISSNDSIGDYSINFTGEVPSIVPGSVITIDQDSIIRYVFVESVEVEGNTLSMKTSQAYLTDIFANTTITLTTDNSRRGNNVFYPIEAFYYDDKGNRCEIDLNATRDDNFGFTHNIWNFSDTLDGMELLSGDNYKLYMEKLSYNFNIDLVMEMNFGGRNEIEIMANGLERYKSKALSIETSIAGDFDTEQMIRFDAEGECSFSEGYDIWKHNFFRPIPIEFSVYGVPVQVTLRSDLFREVELTAKGEMSAYVGFEDHADGKLGFNWAQSGSMTPVKQFSNTFDFTPPTVEGNGSIEAKAWVFPRVSLMLYSVIGPSFDFKPYLSTTLNGGFKEEMLGTDNDFCAWSLDCSTGIDAACGLSLGFMGYETHNFSTDNFNIVDKTLYHSPERIELVPMEQKMRAREGKEVKFKVYDRNHISGTEVLTPLSQFVKFEGDGEFSEEYGIADEGEVSVEWTPSSEDDVMYARLYDDGGKVVSEAEFTIETKVTTSSVTNVTTESARCGGNVSCYYDDDIYERGICWSKNPEPDVDDQCATSGEGAGSFTCNMTGLEDNTTYYVKAYTKMYDYVVYGEQKSFTTEKYETIVNTSSVTDITTNSAICGGNIMSDEAENIVERGICWSTSSQPDINDFCAASGAGAGSFTCNMTVLEDNTTYYVKAYAKLKDEIVYGSQKSFKTEEGFCDPDGEIAGHGYVDLGLPSGLKWATCNVGASSPEDYGDYFAWGETSPKAEYSFETYLHWNDADGDGAAEAAINYDISGNSQYDAATVNWGGSWRMPTKDEMQELVDHCEWELTQVNGVKGVRVIGVNGKCIFLPAGSYIHDHRHVGIEDHALMTIWSSTPVVWYWEDLPFYAAYIMTGGDYVFGGFGVGYEPLVYMGIPIRPITE